MLMGLEDKETHSLQLMIANSNKYKIMSYQEFSLANKNS